MADQQDYTPDQAPQAERQEPRQPDMITYNVKDRGDDKEPFWQRVGAAWSHRDGKGMDIQLDSMPLDGRLTLREKRKEAYKEDRGQDAPPREHDRAR